MKPEKDWPKDADGKNLPLLTIELLVRNGGNLGDGKIKILFDFKGFFRTKDFGLTPEEAFKALLAAHRSLTFAQDSLGIDLIWSATENRK